MSVVLLGSTSGSITLQEPAVAGTNTVNFGANTGVAILDANTPAFRNRIINGAMVIDQRNAGASVTPTSAASLYPVDRFGAYANPSSKYSAQRSTVSPAGFTNSILCTSLSAYSVAAGDFFPIFQVIEGFNIADLGWGTASAQTVTLSFWVRSSLTGTFGGSFRNGAGSRSYPFTYTISVANTWEQKTITVAGDTTGTWTTDNSGGINISWSLGAGSTYSGTAGAWAAANYLSATGAVSLVGTNGATFYITGVQLEKGSTATSFDYRSYGTELALCQRYCLVDSNESSPYRWFAQGYVTTSTAASFGRFFPVTMRTSPSVTASGAAVFVVDTNAGAINTTAVTDAGYSSTCSARIGATVSSGLTGGASVALGSNGTVALRTITYSAEL